MIKKIKKIKNLGVFKDWVWDSGKLTDFRKYNVIYGWNGSGKTSLSRLFQKIETKHITGEFENLQFSLIDENDNEITHENLDRINKHVRVFNRLFVDRNISWTEGTTKALPVQNK